jgi:hypothetical protein
MKEALPTAKLVPKTSFSKKYQLSYLEYNKTNQFLKSSLLPTQKAQALLNDPRKSISQYKRIAIS